MSNSNDREYLKRRAVVASAKNAPFWGGINMLSFVICLTDFKYSIISSLFHLHLLEDFLAIFDFALMLLFFVNLIYNTWLFLWFKKFMQPIELTSNEFLLFGISPQEIGFKLKVEEPKPALLNVSTASLKADVLFSTPSKNHSFNTSFNTSFNKSANNLSNNISNMSNNMSPFSSPQQIHQQQFQQKLLFQHTNSPTVADLSVGSSFNVSQELNEPFPEYRPAIKVSSLPSSPEKAESISFSHSPTIMQVLNKLNVDDSRLMQMVENIRKWISQTILVRLAAEIDAINKIIAEKGFIDSSIGETTIQHLKQLASAKKTDFPTLEQVCAFLDINSPTIENNITLQKYLVRRVKDLAKGGCITEFLWDGGGSYNYKHWKEDMLTDSEIILHLFCVYMDSRLLFNPIVPEGKPFTSQHLKLHNGPTPKSDTYIQQIKTYPPYYSLVLKGETLDLPPGRNNLFYALLVFIHHIKVKNFGLLGRINLGPSGLNIAWVIDK